MDKKKKFYKKNRLLFLVLILLNTSVFSQVFIDYSDFDTGNYGVKPMWNSGGTGVEISFGKSYIHDSTETNQTQSVRIAGDDSDESFIYTNRINLTNFEDVNIYFGYRANNNFLGGDFKIQISNDDGITWTSISPSPYSHGSEFNENMIIRDQEVNISNTAYGPFTSETRFRFLTNITSNSSGKLLLDDITIEGNLKPGVETNDLELWLKADAGVYSNAGGTVDALDTDVVEVWGDQETTITTTNATKAGTSNNAMYVSNGINFNPAVNFINGDNGYFDLDLDDLNNTNFNIIAIVKRASDKSSNYILGTTSDEDFKSLSFGYIYNASDGPRAELSIGFSSSRESVAAYNSPEPSVSLLRGETLAVIGGKKTIYELRDASSIKKTLTKNNALQGYNPGVLGRGNGTNGFQGYVSEVITYSTTLDDAELQKIYSYLALKYGMTLDNTDDVTNGDYIDSDGVVIWEGSNRDIDYHYNVTGIGKDDLNRGLYQKQSTSQNAEAIDIIVGLDEITDTNINNGGACDDKEFLIWGNNDGDYTETTPLTTLNLSEGLGSMDPTNVDFFRINRIWKFIETGSIDETQVYVPAELFPETPTLAYYMIVSNDETFDETDDIIELSDYKASYDFTGTQYVTFGYTPYTVEKRSIYFDGINDYIDMGDVLNLNPLAFTISAWVRRDVGELNGSIISKRDQPYENGFDFRIFKDNSGKVRLRMRWEIANSHQNLNSNTEIPENEWHHVAAIYSEGTLYLYIDGVEDKSAPRTALEDNDFSFLIGAANGAAPNNFFKGNIDEVRIWDVALSVGELRYIMNQEIEAHSDDTVNGTIIPQDIEKNDVNTRSWTTDLAAYYPMSTYAYPGVLIDDSENGNNGIFKNGLNTVDTQSAPLPYVSENDGDWDNEGTWLNGDVQTFPGTTSIVDNSETVNWNIVQISQNTVVNSSRGDGSEIEVLGLMIDAKSNSSDDDAELILEGNTDSDGTGEGQGLTVTHYLKLDGILDLDGESQLIQTENSTLDVGDSGVLERDQQGTADIYSYNYWGSPVGVEKEATDNLINDYTYTLGDVLYDGSDKVNFTSNLDANPFSTILSVSTRWLYKYSDLTGTYAEWQHIGNLGSLNAGEGFTMKGTGKNGGALASFQNYTFKGKPNNGTITLEVSANNIYLVANPYPSAIDAFSFIRENGESSFKDGVIYFWEQYASTSHVLAQYQGGYAALNLAGGVTASIPFGISPDTDTDQASKTPKQYIPVSQGFFVRSADESDEIEIVFNNTQRVFVKESDDDNGDEVSVFMKSSSSKSTSKGDVSFSDTRGKIRLGFEAPQVAHRQLLLTIDEEATDSVDWGYDAKMLGVVEDDMFWDLGDEKYVIQATNSITGDKEIPLGILMGKSGLATIKIDNLENIDANVELFIKDKSTLRFYKINEEPFEMNLEAGEYLDRFSLTFKSYNKDEEITEDEGEVGGIEVVANLSVVMDNDASELQIRNTTNSEITEVKLFNSLGQLVGAWNQYLNNSYKALPVNIKVTGVYIVQLKTTTGVITKKVLVE
ncbi:LamG-like jellyroll fold domain-containing protein [Lutibacter holmesii]|uniref:LamG-like jellyroll fold domain-containing protein n=1 Tax=Lutibacter holmesii TaxID=1137985 RepID=A0ABW3WKM4_9FLAO